MSDQPPTIKPSRLLRNVGRFLVRTQNGMHFPPRAQEKIAALVEVAARLKNQAKGRAALFDLIRLSIALAESGHLDASKTIRSILKDSVPALQVLAGRPRDSRKEFERFQPSHGDKSMKRAPRFDETSGEGSTLKDLFPHRLGQRLDTSRFERAVTTRTKTPRDT